MDTASILREVLSGYMLPVRGTHGVVHWARVLENGLRLAEITCANATVVTLFAIFHDCRRVNEHWDEDHGLRGAQHARELRGKLINLSDADFHLLYEACRLHADGHVDADVTIQTCWDADRLDLGRVGIKPRPHLLCTDAARDLIQWAHQRSCGDFEPGIVTQNWKV